MRKRGSSSLFMPSNRRFGVYPKPPITLFWVLTRTPSHGVAPSSSGFAYGRHEVSPDSEQMTLTGTKYRKRHSVSVEQIQDKVGMRGWLNYAMRLT